MTLLYVATIVVGCMLAAAPVETCVKRGLDGQTAADRVAGSVSLEPAGGPTFTGEAVDVVTTAQAAIVWDHRSGQVLYEKNAGETRPVASLVKLLSALLVREEFVLGQEIEIGEEVGEVQKKGADIKLPAGEHAAVGDLLGAGIVASANDAMVALAVGLAGSEDEFAGLANGYAQRNGLFKTRISNATGLTGGEQYSTARDMMEIFKLAYRDEQIRNWLVTSRGAVKTREGSVRYYQTTNKLLGTYFPVLAAKTGYTVEAGENLAVMTYGESGQRVGVVVLGSQSRFQDVKVLAEWVWRNYTW